MAFCGKCGVELRAGLKYCINCGNKLQLMNPSPPNSPRSVYPTPSNNNALQDNSVSINKPASSKYEIIAIGASIVILAVAVAIISYVIIHPSSGKKPPSSTSSERATRKTGDSSSNPHSSPQNDISSSSSASTLGISYDQMMENLSGIFEMERGSPVNGEENYIGTCSLKDENGRSISGTLAILQLVGDKRDLSSVFLTVKISDDDDIIKATTAITIRFFRNAVPGIDPVSYSQWHSSSINELTSSSANSTETRFGDKLVFLGINKNKGLIVYSVKPFN